MGTPLNSIVISLLPSSLNLRISCPACKRATGALCGLPTNREGEGGVYELGRRRHRFVAAPAARAAARSPLMNCRKYTPLITRLSTRFVAATPRFCWRREKGPDVRAARGWGAGEREDALAAYFCIGTSVTARTTPELHDESGDMKFSRLSASWDERALCHEEGGRKARLLCCPGPTTDSNVSGRLR